MSVLPQTLSGPGAVPLSRRSSRLTSALTHAKSLEAHPPHHAHFDESPEVEIQAGPSRSRSNSNSNSARTRIHALDLEKGEKSNKTKPKSVVDIEHVPVDDDPREWSNLKKNLVLTMMTISVVCPVFLLYQVSSSHSYLSGMESTGYGQDKNRKRRGNETYELILSSVHL